MDALIRVGLGWFGLVRVGLGWSGLVWVCLGWSGLVWVGLGWFGWVWVGLDWFGLGWFELVKVRRVLLLESYKWVWDGLGMGWKSLCGANNEKDSSSPQVSMSSSQAPIQT